MTNKIIHRLLIDNWSSADIIFASVFDKMGIEMEKLEPGERPLIGILRRESTTPGVSIASTHFGRPPFQATTTIKFLIVVAPSAYNMLLGRPSLNSIRAIPSAYHMVVKFLTENGVGMF